MLVPVLVFALAAVLGVVLALGRFRGTVPPMGVALAHAGAAASGLVTLVLALRTSGFEGLGKYALMIFVIVACVGLGLFSLRLRERNLPHGVIVAHAIAAVTAFGLLVAAWLHGG